MRNVSHIKAAQNKIYKHSVSHIILPTKLRLHYNRLQLHYNRLQLQYNRLQLQYNRLQLHYNRPQLHYNRLWLVKMF